MEEIMKESMKDNYIGIDEVAEYLGVKASTVRTWIKSKGLPAHKIGGKLWKFKKSEIDEWIDSDKCNH
ncbi:helix-turn-helix domain-containing protein [Oribacterium sinus]|jgi:DNA binding domain, excisionase family